MDDHVFAPASAWKCALEHPSDGLVAEVARLRNEPEAAAREAIRWYERTVDAAVARFRHDSTTRLGLFRAPGRVNLLGMHIDHRGGRVNPIAIRELLMVCFPRSDGHVRIANASADFTDASFDIGDLLPDGHIDAWSDWTLTTPKYLKETGALGHWSAYVRGVCAFFANEWGGPENVNGFDLFVDTQLPPAAGLSSSSALSVATGMALHHVNERPIEPLALAEGCGQAEWYVGTRGGFGDQAAIALSRSNHVSHVDFFPMRVDWSPWPEGYSVVVCHSRVHAGKSSNARNLFNERAGTYVVALSWIKHLHPEWAPQLVHFRDLLELGLSHADLYRLVAKLPHRATRAQINAELPEMKPDLDRVFATHEEMPEGYRVRDICLYGLAECERSRRLATYLRSGDVAGAGLLMDISHEGDRVSIAGTNGTREPIDMGVDEDDLLGLVTALENGDRVAAEAADLALQPGGYAASCPELDEIVDVAREVEGVMGAGLIGAGLGGCVEAIVATEAVPALKRELGDRYYAKRGLEPFIETMVPVEGASPIVLNG